MSPVHKKIYKIFEKLLIITRTQCFFVETGTLRRKTHLYMFLGTSSLKSHWNKKNSVTYMFDRNIWRKFVMCFYTWKSFLMLVCELTFKWRWSITVMNSLVFERHYWKKVKIYIDLCTKGRIEVQSMFFCWEWHKWNVSGQWTCSISLVYSRFLFTVF